MTCAGVVEATDREIRIKLIKKEPDWWPRLLYESKVETFQNTKSKKGTSS